MADARARVASGERVAVMFGPERAGLENEDVARATHIITVPVNPEFFSLNLAQAVLLNAYEWGREEMPQGQSLDAPAASVIEVEKLADRYEQSLEDAGFFFPPEKAQGMKVVLRNMWSRLGLTRGDVQMLHGALKQLMRGKS